MSALLRYCEKIYHFVQPMDHSSFKLNRPSVKQNKFYITTAERTSWNWWSCRAWLRNIVKCGNYSLQILYIIVLCALKSYFPSVYRLIKVLRRFCVIQIFTKFRRHISVFCGILQSNLASLLTYFKMLFLALCDRYRSFCADENSV